MDGFKVPNNFGKLAFYGILKKKETIIIEGVKSKTSFIFLREVYIEKYLKQSMKIEDIPKKMKITFI